MSVKCWFKWLYENKNVKYLDSFKYLILCLNDNILDTVGLIKYIIKINFTFSFLPFLYDC